MTRNGKILAGAAVIMTLGSAAAVAHRHGGWHHKGPHGWGGPHGMMGLAGPLCRGNPAEKADLMMVRLEYKVNPTEAQKPAAKDITARLADTEAQLAAALEGMKIVRPAVEKLYASLDDAQKKAVSEIGMGKHGKWGRHHDRWEKRGGDRDGPGRGPGRGQSPDDGTPEREGDL